MGTINLGRVDRLLRVLLSAVLLELVLLDRISGSTAQLAAAVAALLALSALWGFCPIYLLLNLDTTPAPPGAMRSSGGSVATRTGR